MNNAPDITTPIFHESLDEPISEPRGVHVWTRDLDAAGDAWLDRDDWLSSEELSVARRLRSPLARRRFVRSHVIARQLLAGILRTPARDITFDRNRWGKPFVVSPRGYAPDFNFSHSENAFLFGMCFDSAVGVDVEVVRDNPDVLSIAEAFFPVEEMEAIRSAPASNQRSLFFQYWTMKEACAKLTGRGLAAGTGSAGGSERAESFQTTVSVAGRPATAAVAWRS